jgi:hypothetical protein
MDWDRDGTVKWTIKKEAHERNWIKWWIIMRCVTGDLCTISFFLILYIVTMIMIVMWSADTGSWSWALLEKPQIVQPLKNFPAFYGTGRFITVFTKALHWSLSWTRSIQSMPPHLISLRSYRKFTCQNFEICHWIPVRHYTSRRVFGTIFHPEDGGRTFFRNLSYLLLSFCLLISLCDSEDGDCFSLKARNSESFISTK